MAKFNSIVWCCSKRLWIENESNLLFKLYRKGQDQIKHELNVDRLISENIALRKHFTEINF